MNDMLWNPPEENYQSSNLATFISFIQTKYEIKFEKNYDSLWKWSIKERKKFWLSLVEFLNLEYSGSNQPIIKEDQYIYNEEFFPNIKLSYAQNIIQNLNNNPIIFRNESNFKIQINKEEVVRKVAKLSFHLKSLGVVKGDRIAAIAANTPDTIISFLAVNSLGAIWSSCSPDFGENAILDRFNQIKPKILMYSEIYFYGGKKINIKEKAKNVFSQIESTNQLIKINYPDKKEEDISDEIDLDSIFESTEYNGSISYELCNFNDPMYILYSSGTTGKPKCIVHNVGGPLLQHMKEQQLHCDLKPDDKIFYFTTCGWMMWNWLVSAMASKSSIILYDGSPFFPQKDYLFKVAEEEQLNILGVSAKYIDALKNDNIDIQSKYKINDLKCILSTGSPLSAEGYNYIYKNIKIDTHLASISGGTDIVSCFVAGNPMMKVYSGEIQCKCLGIDVDILDSNGNSTFEKGELVCKSSIPSMPIGFLNDEGNLKYKASYFSQFENIWSQGDYAELTENNGIIIYGRSDATLNPGGIRIGTAEIYRVVEAIDEVEESIAVSQNWDNDVRIILFIKLVNNVKMSKNLSMLLSLTIKEKLSRRHVPAHIIQINDIPKTRSGKIAELTVRDIINGVKAKNIEALANPDCLSQYENIELLNN